MQIAHNLVKIISLYLLDKESDGEQPSSRASLKEF